MLVVSVSCPACARAPVAEPADHPAKPTCVTLVQDDPYLHQRLELCATALALEIDYERAPAPWLRNVMGPELRRQDRWQLDGRLRPALHWSGRIDDPAWARDWLTLAALPLEPSPTTTRRPMVTITSDEGERRGSPTSEQLAEWRQRIDEIDRLARVERGMPMGEGPIRVASVGEHEVELFVAGYEPHTRLVTLDAFTDLRLYCHLTLTLAESQALRREVLVEHSWQAQAGWADFLGDPGDYVDPGVAGWPGVPLRTMECEQRLSREPCERARGNLHNTPHPAPAPCRIVNPPALGRG